MARSRNIKPAFFQCEELAECSLQARLLFIGLWCIADRDGRLKDRPNRIRAEVFPYDFCDCNPLLQELHDAGFIVRYSIESEAYIQVVNFSKHQNPHPKEAASEIPPCDGVSKAVENNMLATENNLQEMLIPSSLIPSSLIPSSLIPSSLIPESKPKRSKPAPFDASAIDCHPIPVDLWQSFCAERKRKRKPITELAACMLIADYKDAQQRGVDAAQCIRDSIRNGWQGVFFDKAKNTLKTSAIDSGEKVNYGEGGFL
jgi:hypothetical protein